MGGWCVSLHIHIVVPHILVLFLDGEGPTTVMQKIREKNISKKKTVNGPPVPDHIPTVYVGTGACTCGGGGLEGSNVQPSPARVEALQGCPGAHLGHVRRMP